MAMRYLLGVDGGGSKTFAIITNEEGTICGTGLGGCGNHQLHGIDHAITQIKRAVQEALVNANLSREEITFAQFGLAGADRPYDYGILRPALARLGFAHWDVVCDTMEGLRTGSADHVGVVLVCGSGTNAMGRKADGTMVQIGGFGYLYGDRAGGQFLAQEAFHRAIRSYESREIPSLLPDLVAKRLGMGSIQEVIDSYLDREIYHVPLELSRVLFEGEQCGDQLATEILATMGKELGLAACAVIRRLGDLDHAAIPIVLTGSVLQKGRSEHLYQALTAQVQADYPQARFVIPDIEPVFGAIMLAMDQLQIPVTQTMLELFIESGDRTR